VKSPIELLFSAFAEKLRELNPQFKTAYCRRIGEFTENYNGQDGAINDAFNLGAYFLFDQHISWKEGDRFNSCVETLNGETTVKLIAWARGGITGFALEERMRESLEQIRQSADEIIAATVNYDKINMNIGESIFDVKEIVKNELFGTDKLPAATSVIQISFKLFVRWTLSCATELNCEK
jgi:hypothetical protein